MPQVAQGLSEGVFAVEAAAPTAKTDSIFSS